ncbi:hypothetical protein AAVH_38062, partial [Aphelenchoides avenae]
VQCVNQCFDAGSGDTGIARSAVQQLASENQCTEFESTGRKVLSCVEACPVPKYAVLARELIGIWEKYCGDGVDVATREKFLADVLKFQQAWTSEWGKCPAQGTTPAETCAWADCVFGRALTSVTDGFPADAISVNVNAFKLYLGADVEASGEYLPSSCEQIAVPYEPVSPTEPEPPYPYEPYQPETYPYAAYHRNPYQRNPYQRNSYQRNPYQRNSYQRNSYQRSPYKRRN